MIKAVIAEVLAGFGMSQCRTEPGGNAGTVIDHKFEPSEFWTNSPTPPTITDLYITTVECTANA
jgi:hypothetical protein